MCDACVCYNKMPGKCIYSHAESCNILYNITHRSGNLVGIYGIWCHINPQIKFYEKILKNKCFQILNSQIIVGTFHLLIFKEIGK